MAELVCALQDSLLGVEERLKIACYLWGQEQLLSGEKEAILLKWACQELCLAYNRKKSKTPPPHVTCSQLWGFLCSVLEALVEAEKLPRDLSSLNTHLFQVSCLISRQRRWAGLIFI